MTSSPNPWVLRPRPNPGAALRLFCLPFAGGGAQEFQTWPASLPPEVELCAVNLPGRGRRFREAPHRRLAALVSDLSAGLAPFCDRPFALFGHSMGAYLAFELARAHHRLGTRAPRHLFVSGAGAPQLPDRHKFHVLADDGFLDAIQRMNGIDPALLASTELVELMLPVIRADFELVETYVCEDGLPLTCPISVYGGSSDWVVPADRLAPWRAQTTAACRVEMFGGDHFFLRSAQRELLGSITACLSAVAS